MSGPRPNEIVELTVDEIGARGDGIARLGDVAVYVPFAAPGDRLRARIGVTREQGRMGEIVEVLAAGPTRTVPPCPHFGTCGGCALQHLADPGYGEWKRNLVAASLAHRGIEAEVEAPIRTAPRERRRASLKAMRRAQETLLGFYERGSRRVVDVHECPVLLPAIQALIPKLRALMGTLLRSGEQAEIDVTANGNDIDVTISASFDAHMRTRTILADFAQANDLARMSWLAPGHETAEPVVVRRPFVVAFGGVPVELPPRAFLQPSVAGEEALTTRVLEACAGAKQIADLYAGCGTFALPLAKSSRVHAVEGDAAMVNALVAAAKSAGLGNKLTAETRDLDRRPLSAKELEKFGAVVFDPPRAGAKLQAAAIAESKVPVAVAVSCNPATFARDARALIDGGYGLERVTPLDQFLWSPHVEIIAVFRR
jgi:23S rRNA (uracil1939-C5)-methyltransferase